MSLGALDFAGGTVVHISSGISALALVILLGSRKDKKLLPHNLGYSVLGAAFLWFRWMGFNGGSALTAGGLASSAILVSNVTAAFGLITWVCIDNFKEGKITVLGGISGAIAGLVAIKPAAGFFDVSGALIIGASASIIKPAAGFFDVSGALIIGASASIISYISIAYIKPKLRFDDALDVFGIHGMSGIGDLLLLVFLQPHL